MRNDPELLHEEGVQSERDNLRVKDLYLLHTYHKEHLLKRTEVH